MVKGENAMLFQLIKSLTKAEKRQFRLYVNRINPQGDVKFVKLFDVIDQLHEYDEKVVLQKADTIKPSQLANLKSHLYGQILKSLRLTHIHHSQDIEIRENIDYARVLYNKGLYKQSLRVLEKTKIKAKDSFEDNLLLEIIDFEKLIEGQYVTGSMSGKADVLSKEAREIVEVIDRTQELSNLAINLYGLYLQLGCVRNESDFQYVSKYFYRKLPDYDISSLTFHEKLNLYQCYAWFNYIIQDFVRCYRYAQLWVNLFHESPQMQESKPDLYIKGLHNLLASLFNTQHHARYVEVIHELESQQENPLVNSNENTDALIRNFLFNNKINLFFMEGRFTEGLVLIPDLLEVMDEDRFKLDYHRVLLFYYKIACLYFGSGDNQNTIKFLNKIINFKDVKLREDIHSFARILNLIAHYELNNTDLLDYQVKSVFRFLVKMDHLQKVQKEIIKFLRRVPRMNPDTVRQEFSNLKERLKEIAEDPYERRAFLYLDIISWLESKIENVPVETVIRRKFLESKRR